MMSKRAALRLANYFRTLGSSPRRPINGKLKWLGLRRSRLLVVKI
jgi:hypothetical protein